MKNEIKLSEERIHLWLSRLIRSGLDEKGYGETETGEFLKRIETLRLEQLRRRIVMEGFLAANADHLRESTREFLAGEENATALPAGEKPPVEGDLFFTAGDVGRHITAALMLSTGDDPGLIVDSFNPGEDSWEEIGDRFAEDVIQKVSRFPPGGFRCRKFRKGFIVEQVDVREDNPAAADDHADAALTPLAEILLEFAVPVLEKRFNDLHDEKAQQEKSMAELKDVIKKLRREVKGLEKKVRKENRDAARLDRQLRQTKKRLGRTGKSSPDSEEGYMFG